MEDEKTAVKLYSFTYGKCCYITILALAAFIFLLGVFLIFSDVKLGIGLMAVSLFFVLYSFWMIYRKYLNYITLTDTDVSTKKQTFSWDKVYITMSRYARFDGTQREDYFIFFDKYYLSKEEIYSRRVKKDAFYLMVTPKRLEMILQYYTKRIKLLDRCGSDRKRLYDKILEYNQALDRVYKDN